MNRLKVFKTPLRPANKHVLVAMYVFAILMKSTGALNFGLEYDWLFVLALLPIWLTIDFIMNAVFNKLFVKDVL